MPFSLDVTRFSPKLLLGTTGNHSGSSREESKDLIRLFCGLISLHLTTNQPTTFINHTFRYEVIYPGVLECALCLSCSNAITLHLLWICCFISYLMERVLPLLRQIFSRVRKYVLKPDVISHFLMSQGEETLTLSVTLRRESGSLGFNIIGGRSCEVC